MSCNHENTREINLKEPKPILYASEDAKNFIQSLGLETEHVFETIKTLALKKGAVKISVNIFKDCNKDDRNRSPLSKLTFAFLNYQFLKKLTSQSK